MALVLLPCDLPTWVTVQKHLNHLRQARNEGEVVTAMSKIHQLCCVSLDPDEDDSEVRSFEMLRKYLASLGDAEHVEFFDTTLPTLVDYAIRLKVHKPEQGLCYSLQQQNGGFSLERPFVASLLACSFFSCFPKRTPKTHPTLRDFNFAPFFKLLDRIDQQIKLRCFFRYFNRLSESAPTGAVSFKRRVMPAKEHFKIEDWAECRKPLCPIVVRSEGRVDQAEDGVTRCVFGNPGVGSGLFTGDGKTTKGSQDEMRKMITRPELMVALCCVETLEDNEALCVDGTRQFSDVRITVSPAAAVEGGGDVEELCGSRKVDNVTRTECRMCVIDAEDFSDCPVSQFEEIWILRELNKALVGFDSPEDCVRLSPLGESRSGSPDNLRSPSCKAVKSRADNETRFRFEQNKMPDCDKAGERKSPPASSGETEVGNPAETSVSPLVTSSRKAVSCLQDLAPSLTVSLDAETALRLNKLEDEDGRSKDEPTTTGDFDYQNACARDDEVMPTAYADGDENVKNDSSVEVEVDEDVMSRRESSLGLAESETGTVVGGGVFKRADLIGNLKEPKRSMDSPYVTCYEDSDEFKSASSSMDMQQAVAPRRPRSSRKTRPPPPSYDRRQTTTSSEDCELLPRRGGHGGGDGDDGDGDGDEDGDREVREDNNDDDDDEDVLRRRNLAGNSTRRGTFADRLKEALERQAIEESRQAGRQEDEAEAAEDPSSSSRFSGTADNVAGSSAASRSPPGDDDRRSPCGGGMVTTTGSNQQQAQSSDQKLPAAPGLPQQEGSPSRSNALSRGNSSRYSFSSEYSSDVEEMCEKFSHWFTAPEDKELDQRDLAVARFAQTLLIRTLSDSLAAVAASSGTDEDPTSLLEDPSKMLAIRRHQKALMRDKSSGKKSKSMPPLDRPSLKLRPVKRNDRQKLESRVSGSDKSHNQKGNESQSSRHDSPSTGTSLFGKDSAIEDAAERIAKKILVDAMTWEPELNPDVVEGFSWTLAETLIENVIREQVEKRRAAQIKIPEARPKRAIKGILKNRSKSYWNIGSSPPSTAGVGSGERIPIHQLVNGGRDLSPLARKVLCSAKKPLGRILAESCLQRSSSWHSLFYDKNKPTSASCQGSLASHDSSSQDSLVTGESRCFSSENLDLASGLPDGCDAEHEPTSPRTKEANNVDQPSIRSGIQKGRMMVTPGLPRPVATGNWGCDHKKGDPQLKFVLQWLAASMCNTPCVVYYSQRHPKLRKVDDVINVFTTGQWNVGEVLCLLLEYGQSALISFHKRQCSQAEEDQIPQGAVGVSNSVSEPRSTNNNASVKSDKNFCLDLELFDYILGRSRSSKPVPNVETSI